MIFRHGHCFIPIMVHSDNYHLDSFNLYYIDTSHDQNVNILWKSLFNLTSEGAERTLRGCEELNRLL